MVRDAWQSRGEAVRLVGARRFYRDLSGPVTRIGSTAGMGMSQKRIEDMKASGVKPDFGDNGEDRPKIV